jgi:hypothetical protein
MGNAQEREAPQTEHCDVLSLWLTSDNLFLPSYMQKWKSRVRVGRGGEHGRQHVMGGGMRGQIFGHRPQMLGHGAHGRVVSYSHLLQCWLWWLWW